MKSKVIALLSFCLLVLFSCKNDIVSSGSSTLDEADLVVVKADTFAISSQIVPAGYIYSVPDSFLLGEVDTRFGTLHADLLAQFACPEGYEYPANAEVDSVCLYLYYKSFFGDGNSPITVSAYEMDKGTLSYDSAYTSAIDIAQFCSLVPETEIVVNERVIAAEHCPDSTTTSSARVPYIRIRTTDEFAQKFFRCRDFSSQKAFQQLFHGLYITSTFGSATVLNVGQVALSVFFHFTYSKQGQDTTVTDYKSFYANTEVRQVNRVYYSDIKATDGALPDSLNFIVSPAHIYTSISLPMQQMSEQMMAKLGSKRPYVNLAQLRLPVLNVYTGSASAMTADDWAQPAPYMLLCKEDAADRFFRKKELPTDTCAILASLTAGTDSVGNIVYFYSYDLSTLLTQQLREGQTDAENLKMLLVPVAAQTGTTTNAYGSSTTSITGVAPLQTISTTIIPSATSATQPINLEVIYSGF